VPGGGSGGGRGDVGRWQLHHGEPRHQHDKVSTTDKDSTSFCRCKYTAREDYAPALLKHRLDDKLKIYSFTRKTTLL
jgi:hypothetical protein